MQTRSIGENIRSDRAPSDTQSTAPNFDSLARVYRWMEYLSFGPMLERCRFHFLSECAGARHALVLGDGDGRFTARLLAINKKITIDAVDSSAAMLEELRRRADLNAGLRLRTIHADLRQWMPDASGYDLIVSHFFLDCLTTPEVDDLIQRMSAHLDERAIWLISEFAVPEGRWRGVFACMLVRGLYLAFAGMTGLLVRKLPDHAASMGRHSFRRGHHASFLGGLLVSETWERSAK